jgi:hypothetical protein
VFFDCIINKANQTKKAKPSKDWQNKPKQKRDQGAKQTAVN